VVCQPASQSDVRLRCAKTTERIEVLFGEETLADARRIVSLMGSRSPMAKAKEGVSVRRLTNYFGLMFTCEPLVLVIQVLPVCISGRPGKKTRKQVVRNWCIFVGICLVTDCKCQSMKSCSRSGLGDWEMTDWNADDEVNDR